MRERLVDWKPLVHSITLRGGVCASEARSVGFLCVFLLRLVVVIVGRASSRASRGDALGSLLGLSLLDETLSLERARAKKLGVVIHG